MSLVCPRMGLIISGANSNLSIISTDLLEEFEPQMKDASAEQVNGVGTTVAKMKAYGTYTADIMLIAGTTSNKALLWTEKKLSLSTFGINGTATYTGLSEDGSQDMTFKNPILISVVPSGNGIKVTLNLERTENNNV